MQGTSAVDLVTPASHLFQVLLGGAGPDQAHNILSRGTENAQ